MNRRGTGKKDRISPAILRPLLERHVPADLAEAIAGYLRTDYTAERMSRYLQRSEEAGIPLSPEDIVDEMLGILENRRNYYWRQGNMNRKVDTDDLFIRGFSVDWSREIDDYVREIPALQGLEHFDFCSNITFFVGENGSGKSTLLEGLAIACGLNPEGGTHNYSFHTYDDFSGLGSAMKLTRGVSKPKWSYFLRAESFYNVASALMRQYNDDGKMPDYHACSHGESFLDFILKAKEPGIYLLDEPEAALSPQRQLTLLIHLIRMAKKGAQFVIVTHSPILLGLPDASIYSFDDGQIEEISYEETESYRITKMFLMNRERMLRELLEEEEDGEDL